MIEVLTLLPMFGFGYYGVVYSNNKESFHASLYAIAGCFVASMVMISVT